MEEISLLPVREFPDSGAKWLLSAPENVFGLVQILDAEIASRPPLHPPRIRGG